MTTPESEFPLISCERLFSRISENMSSYLSNGLLDVEQFYPEVKWMVAQLGLAVFEQTGDVLILDKHRAELPCDFYLLDSAWLCCQSKQAEMDCNLNYWQGKNVFFTVTDNVTLLQGNCPAPNYTGWSVNACDNHSILQQVTVSEYVTGAPCQTFNFNSPTLLRLKNHKTVGKVCTDRCQNIYCSSPWEISINRKPGGYFLSSTLKDPIIFLKYWKYPIDKETGLPLIPDDPIIEKALEAHLTHWLLVKLWTNSEVTDVENKIKYWEQQKYITLDNAKSYTKLPSWAYTVEMTKRVRKRWNSYEQINCPHW